MQPTHEVILKNGWKAQLVDYFTQGQFEQLQDVMLEGVTVNSSGEVSDVPADRVRKANDMALTLAVKKLTDDQGTVYEGEGLTLEVFKSMPYDPDFPQGELMGHINALTGKKKATSAT